MSDSFSSLFGRDPAPTLLLTAAAQDGEVFLTWSPLPNARYTVQWRAKGAGGWTLERAGFEARRAIVGLPNGTLHEFRVTADGGASSAIISTTPRKRPGCETLDYTGAADPQVDFFCTKAALDAHLTERKIDPLSLRCRQQPVTEWNAHIPNCHYVTPEGQQKLLLRTADAAFVSGNVFVQADIIREYARRAIWREGDPFDKGSVGTPALIPIDEAPSGQVKRHRGARAFQIMTGGRRLSTVTWFEPQQPAPGRFAIYHEGHGGAAVEIGAQTIDWLLARGWQVVALDMPLLGVNTGSAHGGLRGHGDFLSLDDGIVSSIEQFLLPVKAVVDAITTLTGRDDPDLLLIGRSGGGWSAYVYGAVDPRIDIAVSVAGGRPISARLDAPWGAAELGDYEQAAPHLYDVVGHEHLMLAAGTRAAFYVFNRWDSCCFRVAGNDPFVQYLRDGGRSLKKPIEVFVDEHHGGHSMSERALAALDLFLGRVVRSGVLRKRPALFKIRTFLDDCAPERQQPATGTQPPRTGACSALSS